MRALISEAVGGPETLTLGDLPEPELFDTGVLVDVKATALNFPDLLVIEDKYQFRPPRPFAPGGEIAGVVRQVGTKVKGVQVGDRVFANVGFGGLAERVVVAEERCFSMPEAMPFEVGASLLYTYATTLHAFADRAVLSPGERLLILGAAGGVGVAAIQLGKALGAHVIAAARGEERLAFCRAQGADATVEYSSGDLKTKLKQLGGVDVVYDAVGGPYSDPALRALKPGGRFLVIGFASGSIPSIPLNLVLLKECSVVGVQWGAWVMREPAAHRRQVQQLVQLWADKKIAPSVDVLLPLERAAEGLTLLANRSVRGKIIVTPASP